MESFQSENNSNTQLPREVAIKEAKIGWLGGGDAARDLYVAVRPRLRGTTFRDCV